MAKSISFILLAIGCCFLLSSVWVQNKLELYYAVPGEWEGVRHEVLGHISTVVEPGNSATYEKLVRTNSNLADCFVFDAENGRASLSVEVYVAWPGGTYALIPNPADRYCFEHDQQWLQLVFHSTTRQTLRLTDLHLQPNVRYSGYSKNLCFRTVNQCVETITPASTKPTKKDAQNIAGRRAGIGFGFGLLAAVFFFGLQPLIVTAFSMAKAMFPSERAARVQAEMRRSEQTGTQYDEQVNEPFRKPAASTFRSRQDVDDLTELVADAKERLKRVKKKLEEARERDVDNMVGFRAAEDALNAEIADAVARVEAARTRLTNARRKLEGESDQGG